MKNKIKILLLALVAAFISSCTFTETIRLDEPRAAKYERYGYGTGPSELIVTAAEVTTITVNDCSYTATPGHTINIEIPFGFYRIHRGEASITFTPATIYTGHDLEVFPNKKYYTTL